MSYSGSSIKYRPLRIGFLVRENSLEDLVKASGFNSLLWGGIHNPIITISETSDNCEARKLVDLYSVDILYKVSETEQINNFKLEYPFLKDPSHYAEDLFYEEGHSKKLVAGLLDVKNITDLYWDNHFKEKPQKFKSQFSFIKWNEAINYKEALAVQFGCIPDLNFKWDYKNLFIKGLKANEVELGVDDKLLFNPGKNFGLIDLTGFELKGYGGHLSSSRGGLFVGKSNDYTDLVTFWNLRAAGAQIVFVALDYLDKYVTYGQNYLDYLNSLPNRNSDSEDWLTMYHRISDEEAIKAILNQFTSEKRLAVNLVTSLNLKPFEYIFKWQKATTHFEKSFDRYQMNIQLPSKPFLVNDDDIDVKNQQLGVTLSPYGGAEFNYPGYTFKLPNIREMNEFYSREISFDPWSIRIERDGFSVIIKADDENLSLHPVNVQKLVERLLKCAEIEAKTSQPGIIAKKIIEKMKELEGARVFKIKGVRTLLEQGTPETAVTRGQAVLTIQNNDFDKHKRLFIESRESNDLTSNAVFDYLLKHNYFRAGLELKCEHCKLNCWLALKQIDDNWTCDYCGGNNQTSIHLKHKGDWKFRKSGLFAKGNHQEGAVPVLLTLLTLKRVGDHSDFLYTTALDLNGDAIKSETDLFVIQERGYGGLEICIGECKSEGGTITKDDGEKLKNVANRLKQLKSDVNVYIVFSKTSNDFLAEEIEIFKELSKSVNLILFTNKELEPYFPYWKEEGEIDSDIPEKYPHTFGDLHRNSHARYLKDKLPNN